MIATRRISPGEEIFWNYGPGFWNGACASQKLTRKSLESQKDEILYRDIDLEGGELGTEM